MGRARICAPLALRLLAWSARCRRTAPTTPPPLSKPASPFRASLLIFCPAFPAPPPSSKKTTMLSAPCTPLGKARRSMCLSPAQPSKLTSSGRPNNDAAEKKNRRRSAAVEVAMASSPYRSSPLKRYNPLCSPHTTHRAPHTAHRAHRLTIPCGPSYPGLSFCNCRSLYSRAFVNRALVRCSPRTVTSLPYAYRHPACALSLTTRRGYLSPVSLYMPRSNRRYRCRVLVCLLDTLSANKEAPASAKLSNDQLAALIAATIEGQVKRVCSLSLSLSLSLSRLLPPPPRTRTHTHTPFPFSP